MKNVIPISILILVLAFCNTALAQTPVDTLHKDSIHADTAHYWKVKAFTEANFNQASLSNWQGGGENSIAGAGFLHGTADYCKGLHAWTNKLDAAYGVVRLGKKDALLQKTDDEIKIASSYRRTIKKTLSFAATIDFKTNFAPGYKYGKDSLGNPVRLEKLSQFMSPGYVLVGTGLEFKPTDKFFVIVAPIASRITIITNDSMAAVGMYGVPAGHHLRAEAGESVKMGLKWPLMKNVVLESTLDLFGSYKHVQQQVVDWSACLIFKVNTIFLASVSTRLIYDQDISIKRDNGSIGPAVQFKEVIAIGLRYKLY